MDEEEYNRFKKYDIGDIVSVQGVVFRNTLGIDIYMRIATELPLKRLIVGGMDRVYER